MILDQTDLDVAVSDLLSKVSNVYVLVMEKKALAKISSMTQIYTQIAQQTLKCAEFIVHYSETKSFCKSISLRRCMALNAISFLFVQGDDLASTSSRAQMPKLAVTAMLSTVSCNNSEIKRLVTP
jgi:hypothetical protein